MDNGVSSTCHPQADWPPGMKTQPLVFQGISFVKKPDLATRLKIFQNSVQMFNIQIYTGFCQKQTDKKTQQTLRWLWCPHRLGRPTPRERAAAAQAAQETAWTLCTRSRKDSPSCSRPPAGTRKAIPHTGGSGGTARRALATGGMGGGAVPWNSALSSGASLHLREPGEHGLADSILVGVRTRQSVRTALGSEASAF